MLKSFTASISRPSVSGQVRHYAVAPQRSRRSTQMRNKNKAFKTRVGYNAKQGPNFMFKPTATSLQGPLFERLPPMYLPTFTPETASSESIGRAMNFNNMQILKAYGVPRQAAIEFRLLPKPCSVVREVTLESLNMLEKFEQSGSSNSRVIMTGPTGCGKSFVLLQTVDYALSSGWIVLYIPRAISMVNSTSPYRYDTRTRTFHQPQYSQAILKRLMDVNSELLKDLKVETPLQMDRLRVFTVGTPLTELIQAGIKDANAASDILAVVMEQLGAQKEHPVLLAIDDFQALYNTSEYRDPDFNLVQSLHLSVPRLMLEYASGRKTFARGAVVGAVSTTNTRYPVTIQLQEALGLNHDRPVGPYDRRPPALQPYIHGLRKFEIPAQLPIPEATALFELWAQTSSLHTKRNDELFMAKYTESSGNARKFVWNGLLSTLET